MRGVVAAAAAFFVCGCETLGENYNLQREVLLQDERVFVYEDLLEDFWGTRWYQYGAISRNSQYGVCVQVRLDPGAQTSGHSMGGVFLISPGASLDIGYVYLPANFGYQAQSWAPQSDGTCGPPPN